mmetsp:Transcript_9728/g.59075  ORF Transcript_9728/g.59075 Transcript_9728/m.59075 type:complete len:94 (-) Transcript_9728:909-1190(-)
MNAHGWCGLFSMVTFVMNTIFIDVNLLLVRRAEQHSTLPSLPVNYFASYTLLSPCLFSFPSCLGLASWVLQTTYHKLPTALTARPAALAVLKM